MDPDSFASESFFCSGPYLISIFSCEDGFMGETCNQVLMGAYDGMRLEQLHSEPFRPLFSVV